MILKNSDMGYDKEKGRKHYLYLQQVNDDDVPLLTHLGFELLGKQSTDEPETEIWVRYEDQDLKSIALDVLLLYVDYEDMEEGDIAIITAYECELKIAELHKAGCHSDTKWEVLFEKIYDWWLHCEISDPTKDHLLKKIQSATGYLTKEGVKNLVKKYIPLCEILSLMEDSCFYKGNWSPNDNLIYIPDFEANKIDCEEVHAKTVENICSNLYSGKDFLNLCNGCENIAQKVFEKCNGQDPANIMKDILSTSEKMEKL